MRTGSLPTTTRTSSCGLGWIRFYGFGLIANDLIPPHFLHGIITTVITCLGHIFGLGGPPPVLPTQA